MFKVGNIVTFCVVGLNSELTIYVTFTVFAPKKPCKSVHYGSLSRAVPSAYGCNCVVKVYNDVAQAFEIYKA